MTTARDTLGLELTATRRRRDRISKERGVRWQHWPTAPIYHVSDTRLIDLPPGALGHPDLEDEANIAWGLAQSELHTAKGPKAKVDLLYGDGQNLRWQMNITNEQLERCMEPPKDNVSGHAFRICFINTLAMNVGWLPGNFNICTDTIKILRKSGLSELLLDNLWTRTAYWAKMGNQRRMQYDENGALTSFEMCYQYRCGWDTAVSFIHGIRTLHQTTYFCINYPSGAFDRLEACVKRNPSALYRPLFLDTLAADDSLRQWQLVIGDRRESLQVHEGKYEREIDDFDEPTKDLHRLSRHWITLGQDCKDLQAQLGFMRESYLKLDHAAPGKWKVWYSSTAEIVPETLDVLRSQCDICIRWTEVYLKRTDLRINLLFHLANQRESQISKTIATSTAEVAKQTQRDSASMITIAAITMLFLPGTFISAILSTTFFNFGETELQVSRKWWVLLAVTIPLTIVVFVVWLVWLRMRRPKLEREITPKASDSS